jgi:hypothetical protein
MPLYKKKKKEKIGNKIKSTVKTAQEREKQNKK